MNIVDDMIKYAGTIGPGCLMERGAAEILRLRAELAAARDAALVEAAQIASTAKWSDTVPAWAVISNAILAARKATP